MLSKETRRQCDVKCRDCPFPDLLKAFPHRVYLALALSKALCRFLLKKPPY